MKLGSIRRRRRRNMERNLNSIPILEFDGIDYEYWSIRMKTLLKGKGY